jgi:glycosyltransferase involved in cell wall biosynthesis
MTPTFSVVVPVHNQGAIIRRVLDSIVETTLGTYELILILDGCTDNTAQQVEEWKMSLSTPPGLCHIECIVNPTGLFETTCDNQGFRASRGKYLVEIQADMVVLTLGYNILLASPLEQYPDMAVTSGRCCHQMNHSPGLALGKLGTKSSAPHEVLRDFQNYRKVFLSHTVNRGPIVFRASMLKELNYLDEAHYVLGDDDHDFSARAWVLKQWRSGFVPVEVYSPLEWGSTRKPRSPEAQAYLDMRSQNKKDGFLNQHQMRIVYPGPEEREFRIATQLLY